MYVNLSVLVSGVLKGPTAATLTAQQHLNNDSALAADVYLPHSTHKHKHTYTHTHTYVY